MEIALMSFKLIEFVLFSCRDCLLLAHISIKGRLTVSQIFINLYSEIHRKKIFTFKDVVMPIQKVYIAPTMPFV
jgi:hypothetical protein